MCLLLLVDDLREGDLRQIVLRVVVDDLHLFAAPNHLGDLEQGHVFAVFRVVEFPVRVALDDAPRPIRWRRRGRGGLGLRVQNRPPDARGASVCRASEPTTGRIYYCWP